MCKVMKELSQKSSYIVTIGEGGRIVRERKQKLLDRTPRSHLNRRLQKPTNDTQRIFYPVVLTRLLSLNRRKKNRCPPLQKCESKRNLVSEGKNPPLKSEGNRRFRDPLSLDYKDLFKTFVDRRVQFFGPYWVNG